MWLVLTRLRRPRRILPSVDTRPPCNVTTAATLAELPAARRELLLWRWLPELDYDGVELHFQGLREARGAGPCQPSQVQSPGDRAGDTAVLGDDGRYHLHDGNRLLCAVHRYDIRSAPAAGPGPIIHEMRAHWWTDGTRHLLNAPRNGRVLGADGDRLVQWPVRLTTEHADPASVPNRRRCPVNAHFGLWPRFVDPATQKGRIRAQLVAEFGPRCAVCRTAYGTMIDHNHFTGYVRGLLCHLCNGGSESCPHLNGCPAAAYLDDPPAARLGLLYPGRSRDRARDMQRIALAGFDPYPNAPASSAPAPPEPTAAATSALPAAAAALLAWDQARWLLGGRRRARRRHRRATGS